jgi:two-component system cell cycle response regulator DivK
MLKKILVVDDDLQQRILLKNFLKNKDFDVIVAIDGQEGVSKAVSEMPDLIIMDHLMPKMDGMTAIEILKSSPKTSKIPIIVLSSCVLDGKCRTADKTFTKPLDSSVLYSTIQNLLYCKGIN